MMRNTAPIFAVTLTLAALITSNLVTPAFAQFAPPQAIAAAPAEGARNLPDTELLHSSTVRLLQSDYDTQLLRLPAETRMGFGTDIDRINTLLRSMLVDKELAREARAEGLDHDPDVQAIVAAETDRVLSKAIMDRNETKWASEFNARPNIEVAARERWLAQADKFKLPDEVDTTQIVFAVPKHPSAEALAMANAARQKILAGFDMQALAKAQSDEPAAKDTGGHVGWRAVTALDPRFVRAVNSLAKIGDVSEPVRTNAGYHLIRLDGRRTGATRPFEQVKDQIIADLRTAYIGEQRAKRMAAIRDDATIVVNQPAVDALVVRIDPASLQKLREEAARHPREAGRPGSAPKK